MQEGKDKDAFPDDVKVTELGYLSKDGETTVFALMWEPTGTAKVAPKAIVQIVHGMAEHIQRYDDFARYLVSCGFIVCASDHIGHGKSITEKSEWGCLPAQDGMDILIEDVHELRKTVAARFSRKTPYFIFGHSMGSMVVRMYVTRYAEGLTGAILSGTSQQSALFTGVGRILARRIAASKGESHKSDFLHRMGAGAFAKGVENARTEFDWMSTDDAVIDAFIADESCGARFSAGGYSTVAEVAGAVTKQSNVAKVDKDLPLLFVAGTLDPVGNNGKGVTAAAEALTSAGVKRVDTILYEGMRHEVLNEPGHEQVYADVSAWMEARLADRKDGRPEALSASSGGKDAQTHEGRPH